MTIIEHSPSPSGVETSVPGALVVGVGTSPTAGRAVARAAELAAAAGVGLHLTMSVDDATVVPPAVPFGAAGVVAPVSEAVAECERFVAGVRDELGLDRATSGVAPGGVVDVVCAAAAARPGATVVVGNRRVQGATRILGSVATGVVRRAPGDVLVVQSTRSSVDDGPVVVGVDRSPASRTAAARAAAWASVLGVRLHVVMCADRTQTVELTVGADRFHTDWVAEAHQALTDLVRSLDHDDVVGTIGAGRPSRALASTAAECGARMIVVGNRRVRGASRVLGSVATDVLRHAGCDVLVVDSVDRVDS